MNTRTTVSASTRYQVCILRAPASVYAGVLVRVLGPVVLPLNHLQVVDKLLSFRPRSRDMTSVLLRELCQVLRREGPVGQSKAGCVWGGGGEWCAETNAHRTNPPADTLTYVTVDQPPKHTISAVKSEKHRNCRVPLAHSSARDV